MSLENRIACFGSSHTEGGLGWAESKDFINSWPGQLHSRLKNTDVLNAGQSSFSIDFWPTKLLNVIDYYNPTHVLMEINIKEKLDFEMSSDITGESCSDNKNYHPLLSRQNVSSPSGRTHQINWPNRSSVAPQEAIEYHHAYYEITKNIDNELWQGNLPSMINEMYLDTEHGIITDYEKSVVAEKLGDILESMGNKDGDLEMFLNYLYFRAVYETDSDTNIAYYLQNINNMRMICAENNIKFKAYTQHWQPNVYESQIYKDNYESLLKDIWLFDDVTYSTKKWIQKRWGKAWRDQLCDSIHFKPETYGVWCEEMLIPYLQKEWGIE